MGSRWHIHPTGCSGVHPVECSFVLKAGVELYGNFCGTETGNDLDIRDPLDDQCVTYLDDCFERIGLSNMAALTACLEASMSQE